MLFNSVTFAVFFAVVYCAYLASMRRLFLQNAFLLVCSYFFYGWWDWRFLGLIWLSTLIDYVCGRELDKRSQTTSAATFEAAPPAYAYTPWMRRAILCVSVASNLSILGFFKYYDFFVASFTDMLQTFGLSSRPRLLHLILPIGISFYTFQSLSYTIDIYRGKLRATASLLNFALFVAFFPQLVAGPIVRAKEFLPQVSRHRRLSLETIYSGCYLILWGLFKKIVIADNLASLVVDPFFAQDSGPYTGASATIAIYAFAVQIYCDFSGYTDIARGCAKTLGFNLPLNFNLPYFAGNPVEFWRRWHISLSTWFRDYLYIPLGGNRKGVSRTHINLMITMVLCGLWHGAAWTFVWWGIYHASLMIAYKMVKPSLDRWIQSRPQWFQICCHWVAIVVFFQFICLGWLIFRANSLTQVGQILAGIFTPWPWWFMCGACSLYDTAFITLACYAVVLVIIQLAQYVQRDLDAILRMPVLVRGIAYAAMFYGLVWFGINANNPFLYFQF